MTMDSGQSVEQLSEALLKLFEQSDDLLLLLDEHGVIMQVNAACAVALGIPAEALRGQSIRQFDSGFPIDDLLSHRRIHGMFSVSDDSPLPVDISVAPIEGDNQTLVLLVARTQSRALRLMGAVLGAVPGRFGVIDENMQLIQWTEYRTYEPARSVSHLPSRDLMKIIPERLQERAIATIKKAFNDGQASVELEFGESPRTGGLFIFERIEVEGVVYVAMLIVDISDRLQTEEALRESESRFRSIVEQSNDGIVMIDSDGLVVEWNAAQERITGIGRADVIGKPSWAVRVMSTPQEQQTTDLAQRYESSIRRALETGRASWIDETMEWELELPANERRFVETVSFPIQVDHQSMLASISRDITRAKHQEHALQKSAEQLRALAARLADAQENERKRCSAELHDQVGQGLAGIDLALTASLRNLGEQESSTKTHVEHALELTRQTAARTRDLMSEMRPTVLDEYGLESAMRWYVDQLGSQTGIPILMPGDLAIPRLSSGAETALFRIMQEAITNALKYSHASEVRVTVAVKGTCVELTIQDDGCGFNAGQHVSGEERGWGLMIMDERATAVGGSLEVSSQRGSGTTVTATVPAT